MVFYFIAALVALILGARIAFLFVSPATRLRFWYHVRKRSEDKIADLYGASMRCPNCLRWSWEMERVAVWVEKNLMWTMTCGTCAHRSKWVDGPGVMIRVDTKKPIRRTPK